MTDEAAACAAGDWPQDLHCHAMRTAQVEASEESQVLQCVEGVVDIFCGEHVLSAAVACVAQAAAALYKGWV